MDKNQDHPPFNEVIDIDDPHAKCSYLGGDNNAGDNYGIVGGILGPNAVPLLCGGLSIGESSLQLASIFVDSKVFMTLILMSLTIKFQANLKCQLVGKEDASKVLGLLITQSVFSSSIVVDLVSETLMITGGLSDSRYIPLHLIATPLLKQIHVCYWLQDTTNSSDSVFKVESGGRAGSCNAYASEPPLPGQDK